MASSCPTPVQHIEAASPNSYQVRYSCVPIKLAGWSRPTAVMLRERKGWQRVKAVGPVLCLTALSEPRKGSAPLSQVCTQDYRREARDSARCSCFPRNDCMYTSSHSSLVTCVSCKNPAETLPPGMSLFVPVAANGTRLVPLTMSDKKRTPVISQKSAQGPSLETGSEVQMRSVIHNNIYNI